MHPLLKAEEHIPFTKADGKFRTLKEVMEKYPRLYSMWTTRGLPEVTAIDDSDELMIERVKARIAQGKEHTIYRWGMKLTPKEQLEHMKKRSKIGKELIQAERGLHKELIRLLGE